MKRIISYSISVLFALPVLGLAQTVSKHPRAVELEAQLTRQAVEIMRSRFPDKPFLVTVNIDPLHRYADRAARGERRTDQDRLPLSWYDDEEIRDEWDDPKIPLPALLSRVRKALVNVALPAETTDDEISEVQQSIVSALNLVPARDEIKVSKRSWNQQPTRVEPLYVALGVGGILLVFFGLAVIMYLSTRRISRAIQDSSGKAITAVAGPGPLPVRSGSLEKSDGIKLGGGPAADVRFNDPLKTREVIVNAIHSLLEKNRDVFPSLQDMLLLDRMGEENPRALGALLLEFPLEQQRSLFARSYRKHWLDAFNDPGELSSACLDMLQKLVRNARHESSHAWEELLIAFWRLDEKRAEFLRSIDQSDAFSILSHMPKSLAVAASRAAFPGGWGEVLNARFKPKDISNDRLNRLTEKALAISPLRELSVLEQYKQEKDLLDYLRTVEPNEEREIYTVTPPESTIHRFRVPFFKVLDLKPEELKLVVNYVPLEDWALCLFSVPKAERRALDHSLTDKQRFIYHEHLKQFENAPPAPTRIGEVREKVATLIQTALMAQNQQPESATERGVESDPERKAA